MPHAARRLRALGPGVGRGGALIRTPVVPGLAGARALVWAALGLLALRPLLAPAAPGPLQVVVLDAGCRLAPAGSAAPCPCQELPARVRLLRGLPLSLDRAGPDQLRLLPGIGPARAAAIVAERERGGSFADARALERVRGLGPATVARLAPLVFAGSRDPACAAGDAQ